MGLFHSALSVKGLGPWWMGSMFLGLLCSRAFMERDVMGECWPVPGSQEAEDCVV